jgi:glycine/D-amino acid oxidase-like deaminating enzyme
MAAVVVAGGGVVGASVAYYLAQRGARPTVLEACTPACSASGKAGGFLALDWSDGSPLGPLARRSFALHEELAAALPEDIGYRRVATHSLTLRRGGGSSGGKPAAGLPSWVDPNAVAAARRLGDASTTAQVHPERLTKALLAAVERAGGAVRSRCRVVGVVAGAGGAVAGVRVRDEGTGAESVLAADAVVLALGAWSSAAGLAALLPPGAPALDTSVSGLKVNSIVLGDEGRVATADALFLLGVPGLEPEIYPRPGGEVYVCGVSSEEAPPAAADAVEATPGAAATLRAVAAQVSPSLLANAPLLKAQACFLPVPDGDGLPLIGALPGVAGAYVATGHSCWGILLAPATGLAMTELILDGAAAAVDLAPFDPARSSL